MLHPDVSQILEYCTNHCTQYCTTPLQSGFIHSKAFPQVVLAVTPRKVSCNLKHPISGEMNTKVTGFQVGLAKKSNEHLWVFTNDGYIYQNVSINFFVITL